MDGIDSLMREKINGDIPDSDPSALLLHWFACRDRASPINISPE